MIAWLIEKCFKCQGRLYVETYTEDTVCFSCGYRKVKMPVIFTTFEEECAIILSSVPDYNSES